jgi:hypothetical protein
MFAPISFRGATSYIRNILNSNRHDLERILSLLTESRDKNLNNEGHTLLLNYVIDCLETGNNVEYNDAEDHFDIMLNNEIIKSLYDINYFNIRNRSLEKPYSRFSIYCMQYTYIVAYNTEYFLPRYDYDRGYMGKSSHIIHKNISDIFNGRYHW